MMLLLCGNFFLGLNAGGDVPVAGEITLNFPATIYAMGNMFGCSTGFIAPYVIGVILESDDTRQVNLICLWSKVYYLAAGIALIGALIFVIFGSASRQPWDFLPEDTHHLSDYFYENTYSTAAQVASVPAAAAASSSCNDGCDSTIHQQRERKRIQWHRTTPLIHYFLSLLLLHLLLLLLLPSPPKAILSLSLSFSLSLPFSLAICLAPVTFDSFSPSSHFVRVSTSLSRHPSSPARVNERWNSALAVVNTSMCGGNNKREQKKVQHMIIW